MSAQFGRGDFDGGQVLYQMGHAEQLPQRISSNIQTVQQNVRQIQNFVLKIGSAQDSQQLRDKLHEVQQQTSQVVKDTGSLLKQLSHARSSNADPNTQRAARLQCDRLTEDFTAVLNQFQTAQRQTAQAEKESVQRARSYSGFGGDASTVDVMGDERGYSQTRQIMAMEQDVDLDVIRGREAAIKNLESDIMDVNQIFKDLGQLVHDQGTVVDSIEANVESAQIHVEEGTAQLGMARQYQKKSRRKICILLLILFIVLAIIIGIIVWQTTK